MRQLKRSVALAIFVLGCSANSIQPAFASRPVSALASPPKSRSDMIAIAMPSIVQVLVGAAVNGTMSPDGGNALGDALHREKADEQGAIGTGFIVSPDGVVVTNAHVTGELTGPNMTDPPLLAVRLADGSTRSATLVGRDTITDLAVLKILGSPYPYPVVSWGDSEKMRPGDDVVAVGSPFGLGGSVSAGIISGRGRVLGNGPYDDYIQIDAAINPGNSGGPLLNRSGQVIGVNTAIISPSGGSVGIGFSIPASVAQRVVNDLLKLGQVQHAAIGIQVSGVSADIADALGMKRPLGALVVKVEEGGAAKTAGVRPGDVILGIDGHAIASFADIAPRIASLGRGQQVHMAILRNDVTSNVVLTTTAVPDPDARARELAKLADAETSIEFSGLQLSPATPQTNEISGQDPDLSGLIITSIDPHSAGAQRGLGEGDIVTAIGGNPISAGSDLQQADFNARANGRHFLLLSVVRGANTSLIALPVS